MYGKIKRLGRLFDSISKKTVIIPMDHGATEGPIQGLTDMGKTISYFKKSIVNGVVLCKGQLSNLEIVQSCDVPIIVHLSNSSNLSLSPNQKTLVGNVEEAIALGADAISIHINMGSEYECDMLRDFGRTADACYRWGMPLLAMMYVRGPKVVENVNSIKSAARIAQEMGADIIKLKYTGDIDSFSEVISTCSVPVIAAGGEYIDDISTIKSAYEIRRADAAGISFGRNVFQSANPAAVTGALAQIFHENKAIETVLSNFKTATRDSIT